MFRSILGQAKRPFNFLAITSKFCTETPIRRIPKDINEVKIIGTTMGEPFTHQSGQRSINVKTIEKHAPDTYSIHKVYIGSKSDFKIGQRLHITGRLSSSHQTTVDGKIITCTNVKAIQTFVLEDECGSSEVSCGDENSVEILANIASDVLSQEKSCSFSVATHFIGKNDEGETVPVTQFHRVFAYDKDTREYIEKNLVKRDRVLVSGRIGHLTYTGEGEKKLHSGFIVANNVFKLAQRKILQKEFTDNNEMQEQN